MRTNFGDDKQGLLIVSLQPTGVDVGTLIDDGGSTGLDVSDSFEIVAERSMPARGMLTARGALLWQAGAYYVNAQTPEDVNVLVCIKHDSDPTQVGKSFLNLPSQEPAVDIAATVDVRPRAKPVRPAGGLGGRRDQSSVKKRPGSPFRGGRAFPRTPCRGGAI